MGVVLTGGANATLTKLYAFYQVTPTCDAFPSLENALHGSFACCVWAVQLQSKARIEMF